MGDFKQSAGKRFGVGRGGRFGGRNESRPSFSDGTSGRDRGPVTMHQAVCVQCGKSCEVPFRPTEGKPVYCSACFVGKKEFGDRGGDRSPQKNFNSYKAPIKTDFGSNVGNGNNNELKQLEMLNAKMDRLIKAVEAMTNTEMPTVKEKTKKIVIEKKPKGKKPSKV